MINTTLAHYKITAKLGQGGMGAVYRATDTKLEREVAIKVLPESFAQDKERLARFEREAKVLASLNHPNIAGIHGLEQTGSSHALILELVEGEDLSERLKRGPLPVEEALDVCKQIAEALEAAHEKGIIHRDLKPGNVKLTADGKVKVLDFGLAKTATADTSSIDPDSPTLTADYTLPGTLLGTAGYMSPEQARGKPVDKRSDIWSFGCVLYECLTGKRLFTGETLTDSIGALLHKEIDWTQLPSETPSSIARLVRRCLVKNPRNRLHAIADVRVEIEEALTEPAGEVPLEQGGRRGIWLATGAAFLSAVSVILGILIGPLWNGKTNAVSGAAATTHQRKVYSLPLAPGTTLYLGAGTSIAVSPNGENLVYAGVDAEGVRRLYRRVIAEDQDPEPIAGTEGAFNPFFSPDGRWLGYFTTQYLKRVQIDGGQPEILEWVPPVSKGASWARDDLIVFSRAPNWGLYRTSISNRQPVPLFKPDPTGNQYGHLWPHFLPERRGILFTAWDGDEYDHTSTFVYWFASDREEKLVPDSADARYVPGGHIAFMRGGTLWEAPFDLSDSKPKAIESKARPILVGIGNTLLGAAQWAFSANGDLVYAASESPQGLLRGRLVWVDQQGQLEPIHGTSGYYDASASPRLSPDNRQLVVELADQTALTLMQDLKQGTFLPVTKMRGLEGFPTWTQRGGEDWLVFYNMPSGRPPALWWQQLSSGHSSLLFEAQAAVWPLDYSSAIDTLAFYVHPVREETFGAPSTDDLWMINFDQQTTNAWVGNTARNEWQADFSPDGKLIAYTSDFTGRPMVLVRPLKGAGQPLPVADGFSPVFNPRNPRELFFRNGQVMMKAELELEPELKLVRTTRLFPDVYLKRPSPPFVRNYDIANDGSRFLMIETLPEQPPPVTRLKVIVNWFTELNKEVPPARGN